MKTLDLHHLTKIYGSGDTAVTAVDTIDLEVQKGEIVLIMGPSGSGKTTLLSMAGGILKPTKGAVIINNTEITKLTERELPLLRLTNVGFVFQSFNLLSALTALENVQIVLELAGMKQNEARKRASAILTVLRLDKRMHFLPEKLSGGEKQRVSIARALANNPLLVLADEPTANLDSKNGHDVMQLLQTVAKQEGRTVVIVSHDQRIRDIADRVLWLEDGKFKQMGKLVTDPTCGMQVEPQRAITMVLKGKTYYFCSAGCRSEFIHKHKR